MLPAVGKGALTRAAIREAPHRLKEGKARCLAGVPELGKEALAGRRRGKHQQMKAVQTAVSPGGQEIELLRHLPGVIGLLEMVVW